MSFRAFLALGVSLWRGDWEAVGGLHRPQSWRVSPEPQPVSRIRAYRLGGGVRSVCTQECAVDRHGRVRPLLGSRDERQGGGALVDCQRVCRNRDRPLGSPMMSEAGLRRRPHRCRRTDAAALLWRQPGGAHTPQATPRAASSRHLQRLLGHRIPAMTLRYAQHAPEPHADDDAARVEASMVGAGQPGGAGGARTPQSC